MISSTSSFSTDRLKEASLLQFCGNSFIRCVCWSLHDFRQFFFCLGLGKAVLRDFGIFEVMNI